MKLRVSLALLLLVGQCFGSDMPIDGSRVSNIYPILMKLSVEVSNLGESITFGSVGGRVLNVMQVFRILRELPFFMTLRDPALRSQLAIVETGREIRGLDRRQVQHLPRGEMVEQSLQGIIKQLCDVLIRQRKLVNVDQQFQASFLAEMKDFFQIDPVSEAVAFDDAVAQGFYENYIRSLGQESRRQYENLKAYSVGLLDFVQQRKAAEGEAAARGRYHVDAKGGIRKEPSSTRAVDRDRSPSRHAADHVGGPSVNIVDALRLAVKLPQGAAASTHMLGTDRASLPPTGFGNSW